MANPATNLLKSGGRQASDTLSAAIDAADLALPMNSADEFDNNSMVAIVDEGTASEEEMEVSGKTGSSLTVVTRGINGTSATGHDSGATVSAILSDWQWDQVIDAIKEEHDDDGKHTVDVIAEKTAAAGVTVDGLLIKDGGYSGFDGWQPVSETWTYASATTITVPSGATSKYQKGDKFKLTANSVVLYGYIVTVADTLLTVVGDALTNHTFTANNYSKAENPQGFEKGVNWYKASAYLGTQQDNLTSGIITLVELDTETFDINSNFDTTTHKYTAPITGYYSISGFVSYNNPVANKRYSAMIYVNNAQAKTAGFHSGVAERLITHVSIASILVTKGHTIDLRAVQISGVNTVDVDDAATLTSLQIQFIGI